MNTPAHLAASLFVWRNEPGWKAASAVTAGALLPDAPMFGFYVYQKAVGSTERQIWSTLYFQDHWQLFFDLFNSIPIALLMIAACFWLRTPIGILIAASALLHMLCDLPLHHDDAHRHFLPLDWRFQSPISYWDPAHHGKIVAGLELLFAICASFYVALRGHDRPMRIMGRVNLGLYLVAIALIAIFFLRHQGNA